MPADRRSFHLETDTSGAVAVIRVSGGLCGSERADRLLAAVRELAPEHEARLVLDLAGLEAADSAGLGSLVACYTSITRAGGRIAFVGASKAVRRLLSISMLLQVIPLYPTLAEALEVLSS